MQNNNRKRFGIRLRDYTISRNDPNVWINGIDSLLDARLTLRRLVYIKRGNLQIGPLRAICKHGACYFMATTAAGDIPFECQRLSDIPKEYPLHLSYMCEDRYKGEEEPLRIKAEMTREPNITRLCTIANNATYVRRANIRKKTLRGKLHETI